MVVLFKNTLNEKALDFAPLKKYGSIVLISLFPLQKSGDSTQAIKTDRFWTVELGSLLRKGISPPKKTGLKRPLSSKPQSPNDWCCLVHKEISSKPTREEKTPTLSFSSCTWLLGSHQQKAGYSTAAALDAGSSLFPPHCDTIH